MQKDGVRDMVRDQLRRIYNAVLEEKTPNDIRKLLEKLE